MTPRLSIDLLLEEPEDPLPSVAAVVSRRSAAAGVSSLASRLAARASPSPEDWSPAGGPPPSPPPLRAHEGVRKAAALAATTAEQAQAIRAALPTPPDSRAESPVPASRDAMG